MYKQMVIASGSDNNAYLRHSPKHFPEDNLVFMYTYVCQFGLCFRTYLFVLPTVDTP